MSLFRAAGFAGFFLAFLPWHAPLRADEAAEAADLATLESIGQSTDGLSLLEFFRNKTLTEADQERLADTVRRLGDSSFRVRERASAELIAAGRLALPFLRPALHDPDLEIARRADHCQEEIEKGPGTAPTLAAARLLRVRLPRGTAEVVLNYLPFAEDDTVGEELLATLGIAGVHNGQVDPLLEKALRDPQPARRAAAALVLGRAGGPDWRGPVRRLLTDPVPQVRLRAAQGLLIARDKEAIPVLVDLLSDTPLELAWQAEELLGRLAGDQAPLASLGAGAPEERCKCRLAWEEWWRDKGARLDLAKIEPDGHPLGLTLLVVYDGFRGTGRVWECGSDGKARWEITDVQNPIDAQVLPGGRVLIAEHGGRRVTERDHQGKVLWEYALDAPASDCQRLPNGNTFISTWPNQILEVTPDHKVVFSYHSPQGMITSAQKLRNGHIVYVTQGGTLGEVDETGKEVKTLKFHYSPGWRLGVEALPGGRFLVTHQGAGRVVEYDSTGKVLWECSVPSPTAASRLANGHTLVCSNDKRLVEVDRKGQTVNVQALDGRPFRVRPR